MGRTNPNASVSTNKSYVLFEQGTPGTCWVSPEEEVVVVVFGDTVGEAGEVSQAGDIEPGAGRDLQHAAPTPGRTAARSLRRRAGLCRAATAGSCTYCTTPCAAPAPLQRRWSPPARPGKLLSVVSSRGAAGNPSSHRDPPPTRTSATIIHMIRHRVGRLLGHWGARRRTMVADGLSQEKRKKNLLGFFTPCASFQQIYYYSQLKPRTDGDLSGVPCSLRKNHRCFTSNLCKWDQEQQMHSNLCEIKTLKTLCKTQQILQLQCSEIMSHLVHAAKPLCDFFTAKWSNTEVTIQTWSGAPSSDGAQV